MTVGEIILNVSATIWGLSRLTKRYIPDYLKKQKADVETRYPESTAAIAAMKDAPFQKKLDLMVERLEAIRRIKGSCTIYFDPDCTPIIPELPDESSLTLTEKFNGFLHRHPQMVYTMINFQLMAIYVVARRLLATDESVGKSVEKSFCAASITFSLAAYENFRTAYHDIQKNSEYCQKVERHAKNR